MRFTPAIAAAILAFTATGALARPTPQLAGEGAAANSILSDTDNGIGFGIENAEDNLAGNVAQIKGSVPALRSRQLAGEGAAADSILTDTDNGVGFGIENAEDNTAENISKLTGSSSGSGSGSSSPPPPPPPRHRRRQLAGEGAAANSILSGTDNAVGYGVEDAEDNIAGNIAQLKGSAPAKRQLDKIANGAGAIGNAAGLGTVTDPVQQAGDSVDGTLTSDAANAGAQIGSTEESTLENAGSSVPKSKRQLDKIANGAGAIGNAAGLGTVTDPVQQAGDSVDGTLTSDAANAGAQIGSTEESTLENAGSQVPKMSRRQLDKIANGAGAIGNAAGLGTVTDPVQQAGDSVDGTLTSDAANAGAQIGSTEESTLENAGSSVPRRL